MTDSRKTNVMREFWDKKAAENAMYYVSSYRSYDEQDAKEFWRWGKTLAEKFLEESEIPFTGEEIVLEIGSGIGRMTVYLAERFKRVHGLDVSPNMINQARENLKTAGNVQFDIGSGYDLGIYEDAKFDLVFSYITLQHIPDKKITMNYIREAGRVLKSGGYFYFQVNNLAETLRTRLKLRTRLSTITNKLKNREDVDHTRDDAGPRGMNNPAWQGSRVSILQVKRACSEGGMNVVKTRGQGTQYLWVKAIKE